MTLVKENYLVRNRIIMKVFKEKRIQIRTARQKPTGSLSNRQFSPNYIFEQPAVSQSDRSGHISAEEDLVHLFFDALRNFTPRTERQLVSRNTEEIVIQIEFPQLALGMENILLIDIDIDQLETPLDIVGNVVLNGVDLMIDKQLPPRNIARKTSHPIVDRDDIGLEALHHVVQRLQG